MVSRIKTNALLLVLLAGIAAPACAMDADQNSNGFPWKSATGTVLVVGGLLAWYLWPSAKKSEAKLKVADFVKVESDVQVESDLVKRFKRLPLTNQKTEIAKQCEAYAKVPTEEALDTITQFAQVYCARVNSEDLMRAIDRFFAAQNQRARQDECIKIKQLLGLVYY